MRSVRCRFDASPLAVAYWSSTATVALMSHHPAEAAVSLEAEVPEVLFDGMRQFIQQHPQWDQMQLITSALASFLFQNGCKDPCVNQHYLNGLFLR